MIVACLRLAQGRKQRPTAALVDTQSVRTGPERGPRGDDAAKKIKGRKRVLLVDTEGTPLGLRVVPANVHKHRALRALAPALAVQPTLLLIWQGRRFASIEDLRQALHACKDTYNWTWIVARYGYRTLAQVRTDQLGLITVA